MPGLAPTAVLVNDLLDKTGKDADALVRRLDLGEAAAWGALLDAACEASPTFAGQSATPAEIMERLADGDRRMWAFLILAAPGKDLSDAVRGFSPFREMIVFCIVWRRVGGPSDWRLAVVDTDEAMAVYNEYLAAHVGFQTVVRPVGVEPRQVWVFLALPRLKDLMLVPSAK